MPQFITPEIRVALEGIVGAGNVLADPDTLAAYGHDEFFLNDIRRSADIVVRPKTAADVAAVIKLADAARIPVTARGGATGLCGGCVPSLGGIVLSLERMNRVLEIDPVNQMAVVEAGVTLNEFEKAVAEAGFDFPPHPGEESAAIGGMIATNAGGSRAVKYGVIRNYVRGLEVVTAAGVILNLGGKLIKSSSGYNLMHLFIGSEGTLGVITKAVLQFRTKPAMTRSLVIPFDSLEAAIETVPVLLGRDTVPLALEFVPLDVIKITEEHLHRTWPCHAGSVHLFIILDAASEADMDRQSEAVAETALERGALDVFVADTAAKQENILTIRSKIYEAIKAHTVEILDIAVPRGEIAAHVERVREIGEKYNAWLPTFGHAGDGNVHTHLMKARYVDGRIVPLAEDEWRASFEAVRAEIYADGLARGGVVSGEHGIGIVKKKYLAASLPSGQIELMRGIKRAFDPNGILNPGKIFD
ncbi:MAG: FAD-binding oxidoreductase [Candidatus Aminicenantes bacterium]|nr:FAD-binding oxidoreductase [Candidatus Aminicenantes bacterium]